jgi:sugar/nucleoside kinase (ribokinase family)
LVSDLGEDQNGQECLESLKLNKVDNTFIKIHPGQETNYHYILWYQNDRTILVKHQEYNRTFPHVGEPQWLYLTSLGEDTLTYHEQINKYLTDHPSISLAFQPGTFQIKLGVEVLKDLYAKCKIFFCNIDEANKILGVDALSINELLQRIHALGPQVVVITDGPKGAHAFDGNNIWFQSPYPDSAPPLERTGAGDAFSSTTVAALALGQDLPTALSWGAVNSMSVVQYVGAQQGLLTRLQIEEYLKTAPNNFQAQLLK